MTQATTLSALRPPAGNRQTGNSRLANCGQHPRSARCFGSHTVGEIGRNHGGTGMRRFAKFVAGLLVALTAMPVLALTPCRQTMHSMKCCPSECPMMATSTVAKVATRTGAEITTPVCCGTTSHRAIPLNDQRTTESRSDLMALHSLPDTGFVAPAKSRESMPQHSGPPFSVPSRAALCTFLI